VPKNPPIAIHPIIDDLAQILPPGESLFVVGGAVRNAVIGKLVEELDFSIPQGAIDFSRKVADSFSGDFYPLDADRDYGRVILAEPGGSRLVLDFAAFQGPDLEHDLRNRDFTINAMAVDVRNPQDIYDPLGGANDLHAKRLRSCTRDAFTADPIRILRAIRFAIDIDLKATPDTRDLMREAVPLLSSVSAERLRDEVFHLFNSKKPAVAIHALDILDSVPFIFPEITALKGLTQSPPHILDAWDHSLDVLNRLQDVLAVLSPGYDPETTTSLYLGVISHRLGRFRTQLQDHFEFQLNVNRPLIPLLYFAALYHDVGKPDTREIQPNGRIRYFEHELIGADIIVKQAHEFQLSNLEIERLNTIVRHHMRPIWLTQTGKLPSRRAIYRFFNDCDAAGVEVCLLSLADTLATYGPTLPSDLWAQQVEVVRNLLTSWWEENEEVINPPEIIDGNDLIKELGLQAGPLIGRLLTEIREAQAEGQLHNKRQALEFASQIIAESDSGGQQSGKIN
jgi:tRNA nucleotidyltransferase/poly(A) polymerase